MTKLPSELPMQACKRCKVKYQPSKAGSSLPLTYCGLLCEIGDLGFSMDALERSVVIPRKKDVIPLGDLLGDALGIAPALVGA